MELPHGEYEVDPFSGDITQPAAKYDWPTICAICVEASEDRFEIQGTGHGMKDLLLALVQAAYELKTWVYLCPSCRRREKSRVIKGLFVGLVVSIGAVILMASSEDGLRVVAGLLAWVVGLIIVVAVTVSKAKSPVVWNFDKEKVQIRFRSKGFVDAMRNALIKR